MHRLKATTGTWERFVSGIAWQYAHTFSVWDACPHLRNADLDGGRGVRAGHPVVHPCASGSGGGGDAVGRRQAGEVGGGDRWQVQPVADPARAARARRACLTWQRMLGTLYV